MTDKITIAELVGHLERALSLTEPVAGRWVSKAEADRAVTAALDALQRTIAERDAAIAARDEALRERDIYERGFVVASQNKVDFAASHAAAERARDEVGIQLAAAQAEIARLRPVVEAARDTITTPMGEMLPALNAIYRAIQALDTVPGDALATDRITRALEASGIDVARVKDGEG